MTWRGTAWMLHALMAAVLAAVVVLTGQLRAAPPARAAVGDAVDLLAPATVHSNGADLSWTRYTGPSGAAFDRYEIHRSPAAGFTPSAGTLLTVIRDPSVTAYRDTTAAPGQSFSYKVVANASPSLEQRVTLPAAGTAIKTLQPGAADGKATYLEKGAVSCANNGVRDKLPVGASSTVVDRPLLQFDLHDIPAGATIRGATLSVYRTAATAKALTVDAHPLRGEWVEGTSATSCSGTGASWDETQGGVGWTATGGDFAASPTASVTHAAGDPAGWDAFDVKPAVQDYADGDTPNFGVLLKARTESTAAPAGTDYVADDSAVVPTGRPKLVVSYDDGSRSEGPAVEISGFEDNQILTGTATVEAAAGDDRRVDQVQFFADGAAIGIDTTEPFSVAWNTATAANGAHTLTAKATDDVGNVTTSAAAAVDVANTAPPATKVTTLGPSYPDAVKGAAAYGYWRLGEASGATVADSSGRGNTGTLSGGYLRAQAGLVTGDADKATKLVNGATDGKATVGTVAGASAAAITVEAIVNWPASAPVDAESDVASRGWGAAGGWRLSVYMAGDGRGRARFSVNVGGTVQQVTGLISPGRNHLAGRFTGSSVGLFTNGVFSFGVSTAAQALNTTSPVILGGTLNEDLVVDEVALYPKSMLTGEAAAHYDVALGRTPAVRNSITLNADATDDRAVDHVDFYVDGSRFDSDSSAPYAGTLDTLEPSNPTYDGGHTVTTKAYDAEGQETESSSAALTVVNTAGTNTQATLSGADAPPEMTYDPAAGVQDRNGVDVTVTNTSGAAYPAADVVLRSTWLSPDDTPVAADQPDVSLGADLGAGATTTRTVTFDPPALPDDVEQGQYTMRIDLVRKSTGERFSDKGNRPWEFPVKVKRVSTSDTLGLERFYHYEGEELGGGMQHLTNLATGNSLVRFTPLASTGRGLSTVLDLTYNSLEKRSESPVGNNWSVAISGLTRLGNPLDIHPSKWDGKGGVSKRYIDFTDGDGTTHRFAGRQAADGTVWYEEPAGVHLYLRKYSDTDPARKWAVTRPDRVTYFFDAEGYPTSVQDANGNALTYTLENTPPGEGWGSPKKRVTAVADAAGRKFTIVYWTRRDCTRNRIRGKIRKIVDHSGAEITFQYYEDGNLLRVAETGGKNADGTPLNSRAWYFTYTTPSGSGPAIPDPADRDHPNPKTHAQSSRLFSVRDTRHFETTFAYVTSGKAQWRLAARTTRAGDTTTFAYDLLNRTTTVSAPPDRVSKYTFDPNAQLTKITNPLNQVTSVEWTADRAVKKLTEPTGKFIEYAYNANGYLTDQWDELRNRTALTYQDVAVDANDVAGKWKAGRGIPHVSQLRTKTSPRGMATLSPTDDYQWQFDYDARGNLIKATDPEKKATSYVPNPDGTIASTTDPLGRVTRFPSYDPSGQAAEMVDAAGGSTKLGYDADGYLRWIQDPVHALDTGGNLREFRTYFDYDTWHRMGRQSAPLSTRERRGTLIWTAAGFDANDNQTLDIGPHYGAQYTGTGARTRVEYDRMDRQERVFGADTSVDPQGERWRFSYDAAGRLTWVTDPRGMTTLADPLDGATHYDYDKLDRLTRQWEQETDGAGTVRNTLYTHYCYDLAGDLRASVPPKANVASVDCTNLAALPRATRFDYDDAHRLNAQTDALGHRMSATYDADGRIGTATDAQSSTTTYDYDQRGLRTRASRPLDATRSVVTRYEYDATGNLVRQVSPRGWDASTDKQTFSSYVTTYDYDALDRLTRIRLPTSPAYPTQLYAHRGYDANGNLTASTLPDTAPDLASTPASKTTRLTYFDPGWMSTDTDRGKPKVHFEYTAEGWQRLRTPEKADGTLNLARQREWTYFADGLLKEERIATDDANSALNTFEYDAADNLVKARNGSGVANGARQAPIQVLADYDTVDRVTRVRSKMDSDPNWNVTLMGYDLDGNLASRTDNREENATTGNVVKPGRGNRFAYDAAGWLTVHNDDGTSASASDDRRITSTFTATGWSKSRTIEASDAAGAFTTKQTTTWDYFLNGKLKQLQTKNGAGAVKESHTVGYLDAAGHYANGNRTSDAFTLDGPKTAAPCRTATCTTAYTFDARDRLVQEKLTRAGTTKTVDYGLDSAGNVLTEDHGDFKETNTYDGDRLQTQTFTGSKTGAYKFFYDGDGNLKCTTTTSGAADACNPAQGTAVSPQLVADYAYDSDNRLTSFRSYSAGTKKDSASYVYDAFDRPAEEIEDHPGFTTPRATLFKYVGLSDDVSEEEQHEGTTSGKLNETKSYSYDAFGQRIGLNDTRPDGSSREFTVGTDVHGSVSLLLSNAGAAQASYGYSAYGETDSELTEERDPFDAGGARTLTPDNPLNPYRYSNKRLDPGSSTLDMGARRFAPETTRFLQEDAYDDALNDLDLTIDPLTQNRYGLAGGNPISFVEADGHMLASDGGGGGSSSPKPKRKRTRRTSTVNNGRSQSVGGGDAADGYAGLRSRRAAPSSERPHAEPRRAAPAKKRGKPEMPCFSSRSEAFDCGSGAVAGGSQALRKDIIEHNAHLRRSKSPPKHARAWPKEKGAPPAAKRLGKIGKFAGRAGPAVSAATGLAEGEGVGRVALKTGLSVWAGDTLATAGLACGPLAVVCSPAGAVIGGVAGNIAGDLASDALDEGADALGGLVSDVTGDDDIGDTIGSIFND